MHKSRNSQAQRTVLTIVVGFLVVFWLTKAQWAFFVAIGVGAAGVLSGQLAVWIDFVWMKLAEVLGLIMPNILLTLVYYTFFVPLALLSRVTGKKDPLRLKPSAETLWKDSEAQIDRAYFEKTW